MDKVKKTSTKEEIKVGTTKEFIRAKGLETLSLNARKLLYIAIAQCRKNDREFFEYVISIPEFANLIGVDPSNVYQAADSITDELMEKVLKFKPEGKETFKKYNLFLKCSYNENDDWMIRFRISPEMTDFFLGLKDFTQPLLNDFVKMKSKFSMAIWHLMVSRMPNHGRMPKQEDEYVFDLSIEELRERTGHTAKLRQIGQYKERVIDKAIREIADNCGVNIWYDNVKRGKTIVALRFHATAAFHVTPEEAAKFRKNMQERHDNWQQEEQIEGQYTIKDYL